MQKKIVPMVFEYCRWQRQVVSTIALDNSQGKRAGVKADPLCLLHSVEVDSMRLFSLRYSFQEDQIKAGWVLVMIKENKGKEKYASLLLSINYLQISGQIFVLNADVSCLENCLGGRRRMAEVEVPGYFESKFLTDLGLLQLFR